MGILDGDALTNGTAGQTLAAFGHVTRHNEANQAIQDVVDQMQVVVNHGATAGTSRPAGATYVKWVGSVEPTNASNDDEWWDTANDLVKLKQAGSFVAAGSGTYVQAGGQEHVDLCAAPIAVSNFGGAVVQGSYFKGQLVVGNDVVDQYAEWDVYLKAGTYTLDLFHYTSANNGIYTVALDGATIATVDGYAASAAATRTQQTSIVVASSGVKRLRVTVASKNASSTGYRSRLSWATLTKTA